MYEAILIQSKWRSIRCRRKVQFYSQLPWDVWSKILCYISRNTFCDSIDKILRLRLIRLYWGPPRSDLKKKMQTITLLRKYMSCLSFATLAQAIRFLTRLLQHSYLDKCSSSIVNACLEEISVHFLPVLVRTSNRELI